MNWQCWRFYVSIKCERALKGENDEALGPEAIHFKTNEADPLMGILK